METGKNPALYWWILKFPWPYFRRLIIFLSFVILYYLLHTVKYPFLEKALVNF